MRKGRESRERIKGLGRGRGQGGGGSKISERKTGE